MKNRCCETLEMGTGKPSIRHTFNSNRHCGGDIARSRASVWISRGLLVCDCNACRDAINTRCDLANFGRTHCSYRAGCFGWRACSNLFPRKSFCVRGRGICAGTFVRRISYGENCISLREHHACNYRAHSPFKPRLDHRASPLLGSVGGNPCRAGTCRRLAGAPTRIREKKRRIGCVVVADVLPAIHRFFASDTAASTGFQSRVPGDICFQTMRITRGSSGPREAKSGNSLG